MMPAYRNSKRLTWYCSFYFTDWQGKRRKKKKEGFKTRHEALAWERKFLEFYAGCPDISFATLVQAYKEHHRETTREVTHYTKCRLIDNHILPCFGQLPVGKIGRAQIQAWKSTLVQRKLTPMYIRQICSLMKSIFSFAVVHYHLPENPCSCRETPCRHQRKVDYWTLEEFRKFAAVLTRPHHIMAFYLLFWTGMRKGELLALTWEDIDFDKSSIAVNKSFVRLHKRDIISSGKTKSSQRVVIMPAFLAEMLRDFQQLKGKTSGRIFPYTRNMLSHTMRKYTQEAAVKRIRLHDLRHSHASLLINAGFLPIDVADRLGHANAGITLSIYSHFYESKRTSLAERLNTII